MFKKSTHALYFATALLRDAFIGTRSLRVLIVCVQSITQIRSEGVNAYYAAYMFMLRVNAPRTVTNVGEA